jgi:hypothetical protein
MKDAIDMGSDAMLYVPGFIKIRSGFQKLWGVYTQIYRQDRDLISLPLFFKIREVGSKVTSFTVWVT